MRYFLDTEFIEDGKTIDLLSIGIVAEDGREFYLINSDCDKSRANDWVKANVFTNLSIDIGGGLHDFPSATHAVIREKVLDFCDPVKYGKPQFIGYYADYDWVAFCQLFGTMMDLPEGYPMYCYDIRQLADDLNIEELPQSESEHNALNDARWNKEIYHDLRNYH